MATDGDSTTTASSGGQRMTNVYEMFWDCEWCGTSKLLGKTHRSCPNCGAPQDPARRYFPAEHEKVPVHEHIYYGVDLICDNCQTPNSAAAKHCVNCGAPIGDGDNAAALIEWQARRAEQESALREREAASESGPLSKFPFLATTRGKVLAGIGAVVLLGILATLVTLFWTRTATTEVVGHRWYRAIGIERYESVSQGSWCDSTPGDAYSISRSTRQRGTNQIPDGEECSTVNVDNGDGTFRQETSCQTRYRSEPVYDDWCDYYVDRWIHQYDETASGNDRRPPPYWPSISVSNCSSLGCTREGGRSGKYIVQYVEVGAKEPELLECDYEQDRWMKIEPQTKWKAKIRVITGGIVCDSLVPAPTP